MIILSISLTFTTIGFETAFVEEIKIENDRGSSVQGCEVTNLCFVPSYAAANVGQTSTFQVVPEFGMVVSLVLVISIVAVIVFSAKTRLIQKF